MYFQPANEDSNHCYLMALSDCKLCVLGVSIRKHSYANLTAYSDQMDVNNLNFIHKLYKTSQI